MLIWASVPCTGGTSWSQFNMNHNTAREKVRRHRSMCKRIWSAFVDLVNLVEFAKPFIAGQEVARIGIPFNMTPVKFDGCAVRVKTVDGTPIKSRGLLKPSCAVFTTSWMGELVHVLLIMWKVWD